MTQTPDDVATEIINQACSDIYKITNDYELSERIITAIAKDEVRFVLIDCRKVEL